MKLRILSAAVLLPLVLAAISVGGWPFILLVVIAVLLAGMEYRRLVQQKGYHIFSSLVWFNTLVWFLPLWTEAGHVFQPVLAGGILLSALIYVLQHRKTDDPTASWALTVAGGLYLGLGGAYLARLRNLPDGLWWLLTILPTIWIGESLAYLVGSRWGKHKLAPQLSPGKTWEGYASEVVGGLLCGAAFGWLWPLVAGEALTLTPFRGMMVGGALVVFTPFGDYFVSMIKREVGTKDSGNLIPGHGGIFDRVDSLLWAGFVGWVAISFLL